MFPREPLKNICCSQGQKGKKAQLFSISCSTSVQLHVGVQGIQWWGEQALLCSHGERTHTSLQHSLENSQVSGVGAADRSSWAECNRNWRVIGWDGCFLSEPSSLAPRGKVSGLEPFHSVRQGKRCYQGCADSKPWAAFSHTYHSPLPKGCSISGKRDQRSPMALFYQNVASPPSSWHSITTVSKLFLLFSNCIFFLFSTWHFYHRVIQFFCLQHWGIFWHEVLNLKKKAPFLSSGGTMASVCDKLWVITLLEGLHWEKHSRDLE